MIFWDKTPLLYFWGISYITLLIKWIKVIPKEKDIQFHSTVDHLRRGARGGTEGHAGNGGPEKTTGGGGCFEGNQLE